MAPVAFLHPQGQPRDTATPRSLWNVAKAPKSKNLPLGSSAPGAVSRLSVGRFGPDFEPPAPWGQLEVFLPLTTQTYDPPPAPVLPLALSWQVAVCVRSVMYLEMRTWACYGWVGWPYLIPKIQSMQPHPSTPPSKSALAAGKMNS
jgi:hypothetical protein